MLLTEFIGSSSCGPVIDNLIGAEEGAVSEKHNSPISKPSVSDMANAEMYWEKDIPLLCGWTITWIKLIFKDLNS